MRIIRTVLGDIAPEALGLTLGHEHLIGGPLTERTDEDLHLEDETAAIAEATAFREAGGGSLVEMTTPDYGRNMAALQRISRQAGIHIIASSGFNKAKFAGSITAQLKEDEIVRWMVSELSEGIFEPPAFVTAKKHQRVKARAGIVKAASSLAGPTTSELKVLRAAALAHQLTGAPVSTHTEKGTWALEQAGFLIDLGVKPAGLLIGHLDFKPEPDYLAELASLGVYLGLDQFSKTKYLPDEARVDLIGRLCERGFLRQLILSGDMARRSYWSCYGGPGFAHLLRKVAPMLEQTGLSKQDINVLFKENPQHWLSFTPRNVAQML